MQHNVFLPKDWQGLPTKILLHYRAGLDCLDYELYPDKMKEQYVDAVNSLRIAIVDRFSPVVKTINELMKYAENYSADFRVVGGIVILYEPHWLRAQAKLQIWMLDNWKMTEVDSLTWIRNNIDSHFRKPLMSTDLYPDYIDLRD